MERETDFNVFEVENIKKAPGNYIDEEIEAPYSAIKEVMHFSTLIYYRILSKGVPKRMAIFETQSLTRSFFLKYLSTIFCNHKRIIVCFTQILFLSFLSLYSWQL